MGMEWDTTDCDATGALCTGVAPYGCANCCKNLDLDVYMCMGHAEQSSTFFECIYQNVNDAATTVDDNCKHDSEGVYTESEIDLTSD